MTNNSLTTRIVNALPDRLTASSDTIRAVILVTILVASLPAMFFIPGTGTGIASAETNDTFDERFGQYNIGDTLEDIDWSEGPSYQGHDEIVITGEEYLSEGKSLYIDSGGSRAEASADNFSPSSPVTEDIQASLYHIPGNDGVTQIHLYEDGGSSVIDVEIHDGGLGYRAGNGFNLMVPDVGVNEWVTIQIVDIDPSTDVYEVEYSSATGSGSFEAQAANPMEEGYDEVGLSTNSDGKGYFDNVIFKESTIVSGNVVDSNGDGIESAKVEVGEHYIQTDENGYYFVFLDADDKGQTVDVTASTAVDEQTKSVTIPEDGVNFELTPGDIQIVDQNDQPVEGAHVIIGGPREAMFPNIDPEQEAEQLRQEAEALMDSFGGEPDSWESGLDPMSEFGEEGLVYPAVHPASEWDPEGIGSDSTLNVQKNLISLSEPGVQFDEGELVISLWDASEEPEWHEILTDFAVNPVGSLLQQEDPVDDEQLGAVVEGELEITQLGPGGQELGQTTTHETHQIFEWESVLGSIWNSLPIIGGSPNEYEAVTVSLSPGFYEISPVDSEVSYVIVVGSPDQLVDAWLQDVTDEQDELLDEAQEIEDALEDDFWHTREITNEDGVVEIGGLPDDVPVADVRAFKGPTAEELVLADVEELGVTDPDDVLSLTLQDVIVGVEEGVFEPNFYMAESERIEHLPVTLEGQYMNQPPGGNFTDMDDELREWIEELLGTPIDNYADYDELLAALIEERNSLLETVEDVDEFEAHFCEFHPDYCDNGQFDFAEDPDDVETVMWEIDMLRTALSTWDGIGGGDGDIDIGNETDVLNRVIDLPTGIALIDDVDEILDLVYVEVLYESGETDIIDDDYLDVDLDRGQLIIDNFELQEDESPESLSVEWGEYEEEDDDFGEGDDVLDMTITLDSTVALEDVDLTKTSQAVVAIFEHEDGTPGSDTVSPSDIDVYEDGDHVILDIEWVIPSQWDDWDIIAVETVGLEMDEGDDGGVDDGDIDDDLFRTISQIIDLGIELDDLDAIEVEVFFEDAASEIITDTHLELDGTNLIIDEYPIGERVPTYIAISGEVDQIVSDVETTLSTVLSDTVFLEGIIIEDLDGVDLTVEWDDGTETLLSDEYLTLTHEDDGTLIEVDGLDTEGKSVETLHIDVHESKQIEDISAEHYLNAVIEFDDGFLPTLGNIDIEDVNVFVEWQDGTTETIPSEYWHIDGSLTGVGSLVIEDYPIPEDKVAGELEVLAGIGDDIYQVREPFSSPGYAGEPVEVEYISTPTLQPDPDSTVRLEAGLADSVTVGLVDAEVRAPSGESLAFDLVGDDAMEFRTSKGPGRYAVTLLFEDTALDNPPQFARTITLDADRGVNSHSPVLHELGRDDAFAFVSGGLIGGNIDHADDETSILATLAGGENPSTFDIHPDPQGTDHTYAIEVVEGQLEERIDSHLKTRIHVPLGDDAIAYRDGQPLTTERGEYGQLNKENNTIRTFTDTDGTVSVRVIRDPSITQRVMFTVRRWSPLTLSFPAPMSAGAGVAGLVATLMTTLAAREVIRR